MPVWRGIMPRCARCAWRTGRTRSITAPLPDLNFGSMQTLPLRINGSPTNGAPQEIKGSVIAAESARKHEEFSGTKPVEERHRIHESRLDGWMLEYVEGYPGPLTVLQFKGGQ